MRIQVRAAIVAAGLLVACTWGLNLAAAADPAEKPATPEVGKVVEDFELPGLGEETVKLGELSKKGPVVVVVLRGYPGYQCPICGKQFGDFAAHAKEFLEQKVTVVFVYPGPADQLAKRAEEFVHGKKLPLPFVMALDPDFAFVTAWGLRWDAPGETAYPSTFLLDTEGKVTFRKVSQEHGDRTTAREVLEALKKK